jgi:hypothetical protein
VENYVTAADKLAMLAQRCESLYDSPLEGNGFELPVPGEELAATLGKTANVFERLRGASPRERWIATTPRRRASRSRQALRVRVAAIGWR